MKKRVMTLFLALVMCLGLTVPAMAVDDASGNTMLSVPWDKINRCGHQEYVGPCMSYSWAYCRIILENKDHKYSEYHVKGVGGVNASKVNYEWKNAASESALIKALYDNINLGHPTVIQVKSKGSSYPNHYVVAVGYKNSCDPNNLKKSDILILDPANKAITSTANSTQTYLDLGSRSFTNNLCYAVPKSESVAVLGQCSIVNGTYTLTPACAPNSRLDIAGGSQDDQANVQIYTDNGSNAQKWDITSLGNGYYKLTAKCSGKVLDAYNNNISSGQNVIQYTWDGGNYQQWKFKDAGDGYYYISPRCNENLCLDVYSAYSSDGTNIQVYTANQSNAQKWKLDKVGDSGNSICSEEWIVSIPANYKLLCYSSKDATKNSTYIRAMTSSYKLLCTQKAQLSNGKTRYFFVSGDKKSLWFDFTNSMSVEYVERPHLKGSFKYFEEEHPHYGHYICSVCGKEFKDNSSTWFTTGCSICVPSANETGNSSVTVTSWSEWSKTPAYASATREVETKTETERVKVSDAHTEYRYGGYVCFDYNDKKHECWCETYMRKLFGSAILRYSDWSTTRYSSTGAGWTCGSSCRGNHIGVDKYKNGTPWWAQYTLPGGEDYFWEESRTVEAQYETRTVTWYRYRDTTSQRVRITS